MSNRYKGKKTSYRVFRIFRVINFSAQTIIRTPTSVVVDKVAALLLTFLRKWNEKESENNLLLLRREMPRCRVGGARNYIAEGKKLASSRAATKANAMLMTVEIIYPVALKTTIATLFLRRSLNNVNNDFDWCGRVFNRHAVSSRMFRWHRPKSLVRTTHLHLMILELLFYTFLYVWSKSYICLWVNNMFRKHLMRALWVRMIYDSAIATFWFTSVDSFR